MLTCLAISRPDYPNGTITFTQLGADGALVITTDLTQLEGTEGNKWHVHQFATFAEGGVDDVLLIRLGAGGEGPAARVVQGQEGGGRPLDRHQQGR